MPVALPMMAPAHEDAGHLPDARDQEPLMAFFRADGAIDRAALAQRKKAPASSPYEKTEFGLDALDAGAYDPNAETRKVTRLPEPTIDVSGVERGHRALVMACVADALRERGPLAKEVRRKVAGQTLKIVSAESRTGYHAWQDDAGNLVDILYRVEGAPLKSDARDGAPGDNLGNGLARLRDGTWKLVRSMLDYGI